MRDRFDFLIVGAGFAGLVLAERLSSVSGMKCLVVDTRNHVGGNAQVVEATGAELICHRDAAPMLERMAEQGSMFGLQVAQSPPPTRFLEEGDTVEVGSVKLSVVYVPGHAPGHIALVGEGFIIGGDVLFAGSIGRTDLPGGDFEVLMQSIRDNFLTLPDDTIVYCGHGPSTTIGMERKTNPFLASI